MSQAVALVEALKRALKAHGLTYRDVAHGIGMSEASVKRLFSQRSFTLKRLDAICTLMGIGLGDLARSLDGDGRYLSRLTREQEDALVADMQLLLVAVCARSHWRFEDIIEHYRIEPTECIRHLARLDRMGIIELLPKNRIKLRLAPDFEWIPHGPIDRFFMRHVQAEFLRSGFDTDDTVRRFLAGSLSRASREILVRRLEAVAREFTQLQNEDARLPLTERDGVGLVMALRPLEFSPFAALRREPPAPAATDAR